MDNKDCFYRILEIEPFYVAEAVFFAPFWEFQYRFQSLQRHWVLSKEYIEKYIQDMKGLDKDTAELEDLYYETAGVDVEYFPEYLRLSTISFALSLVENMLIHLSEEISNELGIRVDLDARQMPYINKYILWFIRGCGLEIKIDAQKWKTLDAIRELRNKFIHRIDRSMPAQITNTLTEMMAGLTDENTIINDALVDKALIELANLVKSIEISYIDFYESRKNSQHGV